MSSNTRPNFFLPPYSTQKSARSLTDLVSEFRDSEAKVKEKLWVDLYAPKTENDIVVRPARVKEVKTAISNSSIGINKGITKALILTGPSGCGKSTVTKNICQTMGYQLIEWIHNLPSDNDTDPNGRISPIVHFQQFLNQTIRTPTLNEFDCKKVILIEDVPNLASDTVKKQFHSILRAYIEMPLPFLLVFVMSDSWILSNTYRNDKDTRLVNSRDLIPYGMSDDSRIHTIEFLPITKSATLKALNNIVSNENIFLKRDKIEEIAEISHGDIRAAINLLQFYSTKTAKNIGNSKKRKREGLDTTDLNIGPLSLFHAVGKVLYAKRDPQGLLESKPEEIINKLPVDNDLFVSYLHENFVAFHNCIEECSQSLEYLSIADTIRSKQDWQETSASHYRCLESMYSIMTARKGKIGGTLRQLKKPTFINAFHLLEKKKEEEQRCSMFQCTEDFEDEKNSDNDQDSIHDFSEDEYDDTYGDDAGLVELFNNF